MAQWAEATVDERSLTSCACLDSIVSPLRLRWVKGVCVFRCNLPPALLAEGLRSFTCHWGNTGVKRTSSKSQHTAPVFRQVLYGRETPRFSWPISYIDHEKDLWYCLAIGMCRCVWFVAFASRRTTGFRVVVAVYYHHAVGKSKEQCHLEKSCMTCVMLSSFARIRWGIAIFFFFFLSVVDLYLYGKAIGLFFSLPFFPFLFKSEYAIVSWSFIPWYFDLKSLVICHIASFGSHMCVTSFFFSFLNRIVTGNVYSSCLVICLVIFCRAISIELFTNEKNNKKTTTKNKNKRRRRGKAFVIAEWFYHFTTEDLKLKAESSVRVNYVDPVNVWMLSWKCVSGRASERRIFFRGCISEISAISSRCCLCTHFCPNLSVPHYTCIYVFLEDT